MLPFARRLRRPHPTGRVVGWAPLGLITTVAALVGQPLASSEQIHLVGLSTPGPGRVVVDVAVPQRFDGQLSRENVTLEYAGALRPAAVVRLTGDTLEVLIVVDDAQGAGG